MRANSQRERRLAFDSAVAVYAAGRPHFGAEVVDRMVEGIGLAPGDPVLEIGAGTGQLTSALLERGLKVTAVEPGPQMSAYLRQTYAGRLEVEQAFFEEWEPGARSFRAVVSANAFHWVDPAVSYGKVADVLREGGSLGLIWNAPAIGDESLQLDLNRRVFTGDLADFAQPVVAFVESLEMLFGAGRSELAGSARFEEPWWEMRRDQLTWSVDAYVAFLTSLANGVELADRIESDVRKALQGRHEVPITNHIYLSAAKRL